MMSSYNTPQGTELVCRTLLRFLMRPDIRGNWLFRAPGHHGQTVPDGIPHYRATAFLASEVGGERRLRAAYRSTIGSEPRAALSEVEFAWEEPYVGYAWSRPLLIVRSTNLSSISDCSDDEEEWRKRWKDAKVPGHVIDCMGRKDTYIKHVRSIACYCLQPWNHDVVIAIDSVFADGFSDQYTQNHGLEDILVLAATLIDALAY